MAERTPSPPTASLHPWPGHSSAPDPPWRLSTPQPQEAGRDWGRKGEHWPFRVGGGCPSAETGRESQHFDKGSVSLGTLGFPWGPPGTGGASPDGRA